MPYTYKPLTPGQIKNRKRWAHYGVMGTISFAIKALQRVETLETASKNSQVTASYIISQLQDLKYNLNQEAPK